MFLAILEILGTVSFSISGALAAIKSRFDFFGVIVIGCITSIGGGLMRDVIIGYIHSAIFTEMYIVTITIFRDCI